MWTYVLPFLLAIHGLIHLGYTSPSPASPGYPFDMDKSWLITDLRLKKSAVRIGGFTLTVATVLAFSLSAITVIGFVMPQTWWPSVTMISIALSILLLSLFWTKYTIPGMAVDVMLAMMIIWQQWQPPGMAHLM